MQRLHTNYEYMNFYLYGTSLISLEEIQTPFHAHKPSMKFVGIIVLVLQKYHTILYIFFSIFSITTVYAARNVAQSALKYCEFSAVHLDLCRIDRVSINAFMKMQKKGRTFKRVLQMNESMTIVKQRCLQIKTLHERHTCINRQLMMQMR